MQRIKPGNNKGVALMIVLIVTMVLSIFSVTILANSIAESKMTERFSASTRAFWLAEAGLARTIYEFNYGSVGSWTDIGGNARFFQGSIGSFGDFDVTVNNYNTNNPRITAIGYYPNRSAAVSFSRNIGAVFDRANVFTYGAFGKTSVTLRGSGYTDSYDSSLGYSSSISNNGDIGTNGDITISGSAQIDGDAKYGPSGTLNDPSKVTGTVEQLSTEIPLATPTVPAYLTSLSTSGNITTTQSISAGNYKYSSIKLSTTEKLTIEGPANIYLTGSQSISSNGEIEVDATGGTVTIYIDGDIDIAGQGIINTTKIPANLFIIGTDPASQNFDLAGQGDLHCALYAPNAFIDASGQGGLYGSYVGDDVVIRGQGGVHYDETLEDLDTDFGYFYIESWKDNQDPYHVY